MQLPGSGAPSCTRRRADVAFQEFQAALERGVEPLPSAALAEPEEPGGWEDGSRGGGVQPTARRSDQASDLDSRQHVLLATTIALSVCMAGHDHVLPEVTPSAVWQRVDLALHKTRKPAVKPAPTGLPVDMPLNQQQIDWENSHSFSLLTGSLVVLSESGCELLNAARVACPEGVALQMWCRGGSQSASGDTADGAPH